jgi:hypothetical protein
MYRVSANQQNVLSNAQPITDKNSLFLICLEDYAELSLVNPQAFDVKMTVN